MSKRIIIIIPSYNEGNTISAVLRQVQEAMPQADILVVNDGSSDKTAETAKDAGAKVISLPYNMGYGVALQTGFKYAYKRSYECAVQMDGDGQHDPGSIRAMLEALESDSTDVVIGSRFFSGSKYRMPLMRKIGMKFFGFLASVIVRGKITDPTSGFQALNRHAIRFNASDYYPVDFPDADFIVMLYRAGLKVREVPVKMHASPRGKKSMHSGWRPIYYIFDMLLSLLVVLLRKHDFKREE